MNSHKLFDSEFGRPNVTSENSSSYLSKVKDEVNNLYDNYSKLSDSLQETRKEYAWEIENLNSIYESRGKKLKYLEQDVKEVENTLKVYRKLFEGSGKVDQEFKDKVKEYFSKHVYSGDRYWDAFLKIKPQYDVGVENYKEHYKNLEPELKSLQEKINSVLKKIDNYETQASKDISLIKELKNEIGKLNERKNFTEKDVRKLKKMFKEKYEKLLKNYKDVKEFVNTSNKREGEFATLDNSIRDFYYTKIKNLDKEYYRIKMSFPSFEAIVYEFIGIIKYLEAHGINADVLKRDYIKQDLSNTVWAD